MLLNCQCRTAMVRRVMTTWWLTFPMRYVCGSFDFLLLLVLTMTTVPTISVHNVFLISKGTHNLFIWKICVLHILFYCYSCLWSAHTFCYQQECTPDICCQSTGLHKLLANLQSFCFYCCFKINMINFVVFLLTSILNIFYRNLMSLRSVPEHFFAPKLLKTFSLKRPHQVLWHCECAVLYLIPLMFLCRIRHHLEGAQHIPQERTAWTRHACSRKMPPSVQLRLHPPAVLLPPNPKNLAL